MWVFNAAMLSAVLFALWQVSIDVFEDDLGSIKVLPVNSEVQAA